MLSGPVYITPHELLTRAPLGAIPRSDIPGYAFRGKVGVVSHSGTSTGSIRVDGFPIDAYPAVIQVDAPGDLGVASFAISLDGGVTFDDPLLSVPNAVNNIRWDQEIGITGMVLHAFDGAGSPTSFVAGDTWTLTSTASPKLLQVCGALSDYFRKWADNVGKPLTDIDEADLTMLAQLGRVWLCGDRGEIPKSWWEHYREAREHFRLEATGDIRLNAQPPGIEDALVFSDVEQARPAYRYTYPGTHVPVWRH